MSSFVKVTSVSVSQTTHMLEWPTLPYLAASRCTYHQEPLKTPISWAWQDSNQKHSRCKHKNDLKRSWPISPANHGKMSNLIPKSLENDQSRPQITRKSQISLQITRKSQISSPNHWKMSNISSPNDWKMPNVIPKSLENVQSRRQMTGKSPIFSPNK